MGYDELHNVRQGSTVYYWVDPDTGAALEHTGVNDDSIPFFGDVGAAETYLEEQADQHGKELYEQYSLYEAQTKKAMDAVDVLADQSDIKQFF